MATRLNTVGQDDELRRIFLKWSKVALSLSMMAGAFLMVLGPKFIGWWIGPDYEGPSGIVLQILMASSLVFLPVRGVALPILMGIGKPKVPTVAFIGAGALNLVLSILLSRPFGLAGVAIGTAIPNVLFAGVVLIVACRELRVPLTEYLGYVVPRATIGAAPGVALLLWWRVALGVDTLFGLVSAGTAMVALFGVCSVVFVYRNDRFVDVRLRLARLRAWGRA
jgi:O-antigen/teichoic acid export membrane protein